ncbi:GAF domain-containing protein [bacterium CPR1]|nr:GAF domain-containing protein [bacterium CPR1]
MLPDYASLLELARRLQRASTFRELLQEARDEVERSTGYRHVWIYVLDSPDIRRARLLDFAGSREAQTWEKAPMLEIEGDAMLEEIVSARGPVVVVDSRSDPRTNKSLVAQLECRTLINLPLILPDYVLGAFGVGTFGEEGVRAPTPEQLDYLMHVAGQLAGAVARVRLEEERAITQRYQRQLFLMQKMDTVGMLAAGVLHDLKALLAAIVGCAELLAESGLSPEQQRDLELLTQAARQAEGLTRPLVAIARQQTLRPGEVDLAERLTRLEPGLRAQLPDGVELVVQTEPSLPPVVGDSDLLEQVVSNLVLNARDALKGRGQIRIALDLGVCPFTPGPCLRLRVSDTGPGIAAEIQDRVFDPFFTTKGLGLGLGLAVCAGIVRQHEGSITFESEPGRGTTFTVFLPPATARSKVPA